MDDQLKLLISVYEEEKIRLQKLIDACIAETEYLMAHYHSEALHQLNGRLQTLNNIEDKLYDEKESRQRWIDGLQKQIEVESLTNMKEYLEKRLQHEKEALERLNQTPKQATPSHETLLDETLKKLVDKKIKNLRLVLKKTDNLFLSFSYSKKVRKLTLPYGKQHTKKWILNEDHINAFKNMGFELAESETKLCLTLSGDKEDILNRVQLILSKIVFEIFYFKEFANESYIQFADKSSR